MMKNEIGYDECSAYQVSIYCGRRVGYTDEILPLSIVERICDEFVNDEKYCVTITETQFKYVNGSEPGVIVGLIKYPRFPKKPDVIRSLADKLARKLLIGMKQIRVSVATHTTTFMLTNMNLERKYSSNDEQMSQINNKKTKSDNVN